MIKIDYTFVSLANKDDKKIENYLYIYIHIDIDISIWLKQYR